MDLHIVAFYTLCDDLLIQHGYQADPRTKTLATCVSLVGAVRSRFSWMLGTA